MPQCRLFEKEKKLVKAHIVPKWAFVESKQNKNEPLLVISKGKKPEKSYIGIYDQNILSDKAEKLTEKWDNYAKKFFTEKYPIQKITDGIRTESFYKIKSLDYEKLKLFCISVLWKASITKRSEYKLISLGKKYEECARKMILKNNTGDEEDFSIIMSKFTSYKEVKGAEKSFLSPYKTRIENVTFNVIRIIDWTIYIKTSNQSMPCYLQPFVLSLGRPFVVFSRDFSESNDLRSIYEIMAN